MATLRTQYSLAAHSLATAVPEPEGLAQVTELFKSTFLRGNRNIVELLAAKGFMDINRRECVDHYEGALQLLAKIAQTFPEAMIQLWSDQLSDCLRQLLLDQTKHKEESKKTVAQGSTTSSGESALMLQMHSVNSYQGVLGQSTAALSE